MRTRSRSRSCKHTQTHTHDNDTNRLANTGARMYCAYLLTNMITAHTPRTLRTPNAASTEHRDRPPAAPAAAAERRFGRVEMGHGRLIERRKCTHTLCKPSSTPSGGGVPRAGKRVRCANFERAQMKIIRMLRTALGSQAQLECALSIRYAERTHASSACASRTG